ncbi:MAG: alpha-glucosidase/alpha-galactosidase [Spirochaetia bacterium]
MPKITFIGAGSLVFTRNLCTDILNTPALAGATICLMDINGDRLKQARQVVDGLVDGLNAGVAVESTTDRREAIRNADYVITTFQQGGLEAYAMDIEIPARYGVGQCVGDTLGPGGVFRALRTIPVMQGICREMDEVAPDALLLNYVNPMAAVCWAVDRLTARPHVGLCHSVQHTSSMLAEWIHVPIEEVTYRCAGINHQAFFLDFQRGRGADAEDLYPRIREASENADIYGQEPVRIEMMRHLGYFVTESSGHASEYLPWFRKSGDQIESELVPKFTSEVNDWLDYGRTGGYLKECRRRQAEFMAEFDEIVRREPKTERSNEFGSFIMEAMESEEPTVINGNVPNRGLIENLPEGACVEVPCLVDRNGVQPTAVGRLPPQLAALNRTNVNVQELIVEASATGNTDAVHHAVSLDPMTGANCTLEEIHDMVSEMLTAEAQWLPQF